MLQWIRKHRKALAGISVGAGAFFAAISFITYKVMAAEELSLIHISEPTRRS